MSNREHEYGPWLPGRDCGLEADTQERRCARCGAKQWRHDVRKYSGISGYGILEWTEPYGNVRSEKPC